MFVSFYFALHFIYIQFFCRFLARINNKLNYVLQVLDSDFEDPFSPFDEKTLFNAFLTLRDQHDTKWKLVKKEEWHEFRKWEERGTEEESGEKDVLHSGPCISDVPI